MSASLVKHCGGCHCGAVRFEVLAPSQVHVYHCNCSICVKKQNWHIIVPRSNFTLLKGEDSLKTYTFGTHQAKHMFCSICGVQSFYIPRSNPDGYGVCPHCLDPGTVESMEVEEFDGSDWQTAFDTSDIKHRSKQQSTSDITN
ncbi:hypothetical protein ScPMuIL_007073 [Solemya velum]